MEKLKKQTNKKLTELTKEITEDVHETVEHLKQTNKKIIEEISKNIKKIEWAPVKVPPRRRIQTLAAGLYVYIFMVLPFVSMILASLILLYLNYMGRAFLLIYLAYIYYDHKKNCSAVRGNGWKRLRNNFFTNHLRDYFPVELIKTVDLKPDRNYLLASFPHGIIGTGISINMGNNIGKWLELFPGIRPKIATLDMHFYIPFMRELFRLWGLVSCSKESLTYYLTRPNDPKSKANKDGFTSNAVAVLVGGAQESLDSHPGRYILTLKNRKGFVKIAIRTGSPIVPTFSFGEVDIFDQVANPPESLLRKVQTLVKRITGVSPLIVLGRGFFQYSFGFLPQRKHIVQVVGAPIEVEKMPNPSPEYVDEIHQKVIDSLNEMFEKYKHKYIENADKVNLVIN
ncbi:2-acylglycerol O-acyltransferase 2-A-like [Lucilia sericata]|uniref:2-acylglycerol O-acyltransferase 2-A-like n=1 Tax=Lucilia sericata TaxID=13632 RepID=UPI0018A85982|nr:2-acylglycerol O-acyltransferase 2-A-like [Lucilia sericata]